jgi:hypothetical protein
MSQVGYAGTGVRTLQRWTTFAVLLLLSQQGQSRAQKPLTSDPAQSSVAVERQPVADLGNNYSPATTRTIAWFGPARITTWCIAAPVREGC